jgi:serine/threonine-protein kinase
MRFVGDVPGGSAYADETMAQSDHHAFAATVAAEGAHGAPTDATAADAAAPLGATVTYAGQSPMRTAGGTIKTAVLPRLSGEQLVHDGRVRYEVKRVLGAGGMGEVALAEDQDIGRPVAVKYLTAPQDGSLVARFVEEIHTVGSLEHPNIVPIHDVGVDDQGRYFFVMKHIEGETLEEIIEKLAAGNPEYHAKYTYTARIELFVSLLRALQFAHSRGFVHRDIKPANVMVGKFGEVVLMDWGVAKAVKAPSAAPSAPRSDALAEGPASGERARLFTTRHGALVGTPAYMSPEQARGAVDAIDERSDLYSACVLFNELVTLRHYMEDRTTMSAMLEAIIRGDFELNYFGKVQPVQGQTPPELYHFCARGLKRDPAERWQSATQMIDELSAILDGRVRVQCPFTLSKRIAREASRLIDRRPIVAIGMFGFGALVVAWSGVATVLLLTH